MKRWGKKVPYGFVRRVSRQLGKRATQALVAGAYGALSTAANSATGGMLGGSSYQMAKAGWKDGKKYYKSAFPRARYAKLSSNKVKKATRTGSNKPRGPVLGSNKSYPRNNRPSQVHVPVLGSNPDTPQRTKHGMPIKHSKMAHKKSIRYK